MRVSRHLRSIGERPSFLIGLAYGGSLMIPYVLLVAAVAGLSEGAIASTRRARLRELANRLGLGASPAKSDLRARLLWVKSHYPLEAFRRVARSVQDYEHGDYWTIEDFEDIVAVRMPPSGFRSDLEPIISWLGREAVETHISSYALPSLLDWFESENPDLMSMSWDEAVEASAEWHRQFIGQAEYGKPAHKGVTIATWSDGSTLQRLVTEVQIGSEGTSMGHCVGGYWSEVRDGSSVILSYRESDGTPQATLEIKASAGDRIAIVQARARDDEIIDDKRVLNRLAHFVLDWQIWPGELGISYPALPDEIVALARATKITPEMEEALSKEGRDLLRAWSKVRIASLSMQDAEGMLEALRGLSEKPNWDRYSDEPEGDVSYRDALDEWLDRVRGILEAHGKDSDYVDEDFTVETEQRLISDVVLSELSQHLWKAADDEARYIDRFLRSSGWGLAEGKERARGWRDAPTIWELYQATGEYEWREPQYIVWLHIEDYENLPGWGSVDFKTWKQHRGPLGYQSRTSMLEALVNHGGPVVSQSEARADLVAEIEKPDVVSFTKEEALGSLVPFLSAAKQGGIPMTRDAQRTFERLRKERT